MKPRSERSRWVRIFALLEPNKDNQQGYAQQEHQKAVAIIRAFEKVGRIVRVQVDGNAIEFRARK